MLHASKKLDLFKSAGENLRLLKNEPGNDIKLKLYAFFKQVYIGFALKLNTILCNLKNFKI